METTGLSSFAVVQLKDWLYFQSLRTVYFNFRMQRYMVLLTQSEVAITQKREQAKVAGEIPNKKNAIPGICNKTNISSSGQV